MKVITVIGDTDSGKTTLLNYLYEFLKNDGADIMQFKREGDKKDDVVVLLYWHSKKIVICSIGDAMRYIKFGTELAKIERPDILINALTSNISCQELKDLLSWVKEDEMVTPIKIQMAKFKKDYDAQTRQKQEKFQQILGEIEKQ